MNSKSTLLLDGLSLPEGPRWHNGKLWFSDMHSGRILVVSPDGSVKEVVKLKDQTSGLGWLPDGRLLIVSMMKRKLLCLDNGSLITIADLSELASYHCNDMVVDLKGRAYIGNFGFDARARQQPKLAEIVMVSENGEAKIVATDLAFPNGMVITPDERILIVAETRANRLTSFDIAKDGSLSKRQTWAQLAKGIAPDGICLDSEGAVWLASPTGKAVYRVKKGGEILQQIEVDYHTYACMLGGDDGKTLYICESGAIGEDRLVTAMGRIETVRVDTAGAGLP